MSEVSTSPKMDDVTVGVDLMPPERRLTVELCLYGLLVLVALVVRLVALGRWPLLPEEVPTALAARVPFRRVLRFMLVTAASPNCAGACG